LASCSKPQSSKRYRSAFPATGGSIGAFVFLIVGVGMVVDGLHSGIAESIIGGLAVVLAFLLTGQVLTSYAAITPAGLAYRFNFRRKLIPWTSIESLRAARGPGTGVWAGLVVERRWDRPVLVGSVVGTRRHVEQIIADIEGYRARLDPAPSNLRDS
jgi:hypothetical protein